MRKWVFLVTGIFLMSSTFAFAQDPGNQDSLIIAFAEVPQDTINWTTVNIRVDFVTDDSIMFLNFPVTWTTSDGLIFPGTTVWRFPFTDWDDPYDTLLLDELLLRQVCWADVGGEDNPPLFTAGQRLWGMSLRFVINPDAEEQFVWVDTTFDPINQSVLFGGINGTYEFTPAVVRGYIRYGEATGIDDEEVLPTEFALRKNYPNPFNPLTKINFDLPNPEMVSIEIYNILGQNVKTLVSDYRDAGRHSVIWDGTNNSGRSVPSGIYFYRMIAGDFTATDKMMLIR